MAYSEHLDQSYYVSCKLRLVIRFEELGSGDLNDKAPAKTTPRLDGVKDERAPLVVRRQADPFDGIERFVLVADQPGGKPSGPQTPTRSSDLRTFEITGVVPHTASLKINGIRVADQLSAELQYRDFPFHPALIRAVAVEMYLGTITPEEFAQGQRGLTRGDIFGPSAANAGEPMNLVPDTYLDLNGRQRTNLRFQGWVDKYQLSRNNETVHLTCTDNTRLLIKQLAPPRLVISQELPIDEAIAQYLSHFPQMEGLSVLYQPSSAARTPTNPPRMKGALGPQATRPTLGPQASKGGGASGGGKLNVLDYITDVCGAIGHIAYVDGTTLIVRQPRTLLDGQAQPREDDPYRTRHLESGDYPSRTFVIGRNVKDPSWSRDLAGENEPKNIEVRCWSPRTKQTLVARWPAKGDRVTTAQPGDGKTDQEWRVIEVSGIDDPAILLDIAQQNYELQRLQITVDFETDNLSSFGGDNDDPDVLDIRPGDTIDILQDAAAVSTAGQVEDDLSTSEKAAKSLEDLGYPRDLATFYGNLYGQAGFQRSYRFREGEIAWAVESGVKLKLTCTNYVEARVGRDVASPAGQSPASPKTGRL